ncbi:MAG: P-II family nitrogen regulator [Gemmatimonadota bacterium]
MKEIKAFVRSERLAQVHRALQDAGAGAVTVLHVRSIRGPMDAESWPVSLEAGAHYAEHVKLELVCPESALPGLVSIILDNARTGAPGDGILYVSPVERAIKIRTGAEGREALG